MKIIFIPGNGGGGPNDNWFPYLKKELEKYGVTIIASEFPDNDLAREKYWLPFIKNILKADKDTILIGHSSGAVAAMRFAENNKILGSVLVGVCYTDLGDEKEKVSGYYNRPWNWKNIKNNQEWIIEFASTDDPFIPIEEPRFIQKKLNSQYYEYTSYGHFHHIKTFPELLTQLKEKLKLASNFPIISHSKAQGAFL